MALSIAVCVWLCTCAHGYLCAFVVSTSFSFSSLQRPSDFLAEPKVPSAGEARHCTHSQKDPRCNYRIGLVPHNENNSLFPAFFIPTLFSEGLSATASWTDEQRISPEMPFFFYFELFSFFQWAALKQTWPYFCRGSASPRGLFAFLRHLFSLHTLPSCEISAHSEIPY